MRGLAIVLAGGLLFGFGLAWSTMVRPEVVLDFVQLQDFGLLLTMGGALAVTLPIYQLAPRARRRPPLGLAFERFPKRITAANVGGGVLFGIGWGVSGVCPGAAIASVGVGNWPILFALAGMLIGAYLQGAAVSRPSAAPSGI